jgi:hypothetical protein
MTSGLTKHTRDGRSLDMARLLGILVCLTMLLSLMMGGAAHASEQTCLPGVEAIANGHVDGDGDQAPHGDNDKAHHHGGCHGHHLATPEAAAGPTPAAPRSRAVATRLRVPATAAPPRAELRPPIA